MVDFFKNLLSADFMPHGHCYLWSPEIVYLHVLSDALIALAYYSIPVTLIYFVRKRRDLPYAWMFCMFGGFIVACGSTHLMEIWTVWHGTYRLAGAVKVVTALLSISTAILLVKLVPTALSLRSPKELAKVNQELEHEITQRKRAEASLRQSREELESRVTQRTEALAKVNAALQNEITERVEAEEALRESEERFRATFEQAAVGIGHVAPNGRWLRVNRKLCEIVGYAHEELLARTYQQITHPADVDADNAHARRVLTNEIQTYSMEKRFIRKDGSEVWIELTVSLVRDPTGQPKYFISVVEDISRRKQAEEALKDSLTEKETLLKEIHHRVKNNMQLISSLLQLQAGCIKDPDALAVFRESQNRIRSMALIHEKLYQASSLARIDFAEYVSGLVSILIRSYAPKAQAVTVDLQIEPASLGLDMAIPFGLILNELISNSLKHAFPDNRQGVIAVALHRAEDARFELMVRDDGIGFAPGFAWETCSTLGLRLIRILTEQIEGHLEVQSGQGVEYRMRFQEPKSQRKELTSWL